MPFVVETFCIQQFVIFLHEWPKLNTIHATHGRKTLIILYY